MKIQTMLERGYKREGDKFRLRSEKGGVISTYHYKMCKKCSEGFAASHHVQEYCSNECSFVTKNFNPGWRLGKKFINERGGVGRKRKSSNGYIEIYLPGHPLADKRSRVLEHRLVIFNKIKRSLASNEVVHHINGNRSDNRIENLVLLTKAEHNSHHKSEEARDRERDDSGRFL